MDVNELPPVLRKAIHAPRFISRLLLSRTPFRYKTFLEGRRELADRFLFGEGIEIGALNQPLEVPSHVKVRYVDRLKESDLRIHYPELAGQKLVAVDIIDDGESLMTIPESSLDFIIANHMLEHCEDPIRTLKNFLRVVRPEGILFISVPDKRFTFDRKRGLTPNEHLATDHADGPQISREEHYLEWTERVMRKTGDKIAETATELMRGQISIHFHVWTTKTFREFLSYVKQAYQLPFETLVLRKNEYETVVVLKRKIEK